MALIDDIKKVLGMTTIAKDTELADLILSAKLDLKISGVDIIEETDPLIKRAITAVKKKTTTKKKIPISQYNFDRVNYKF